MCRVTCMTELDVFGELIKGSDNTCLGSHV